MSSESSMVSIQGELDVAFNAYVVANQSPGLACGIVSTDGLIHSAGFGRANDSGVDPNADTPFPIASMSKSFTAAAALIARDHGLFSLEDPITKYLPEFRASGALEDPCVPPTIRMCSACRAG